MGTESENKSRLLGDEDTATMQLEWGDGVKSFATDAGGKPSFTLKTAHQEKTYEMFREHDSLINHNSRNIGLLHVALFVGLTTVACIYANVYVNFALLKNQVSVAEEEVYTELLGMQNVTVTIKRLEMLSHNTREYENKILYDPNMLLPAYHRRLMATLFQINSRIIRGLEYIRSYDQTIRVATSCLYNFDNSKYTTKNCPLADVAAHLKAVDPKQADALLKALMKVKLPLSESLDQKILELYPSAWVSVTQPSDFVHSLIGDNSFDEIIQYSQMYLEQLQEIVDALRKIIIWPPLVATPAVFGAVSACLLLLFAIFTGVNSSQKHSGDSL